MQIYDIILFELPNELTFFARDEAHAASLLQSWYQPRFKRPCVQYAITLASDYREVDEPWSTMALKREQAGVAVWIDIVGWAVISPDLEAPGPFYREMDGVRAFEFAGRSTGVNVAVIAACQEGACLLHETWCEIQGVSDCWGFEITIDSPRFWQADSPLGQAIALGATGVVSLRSGKWDLLPPWDPGAGAHKR